MRLYKADGWLIHTGHRLLVNADEWAMTSLVLVATIDLQVNACDTIKLHSCANLTTNHAISRRNNLTIVHVFEIRLTVYDKYTTLYLWLRVIENKASYLYTRQIEVLGCFRFLIVLRKSFLSFCSLCAKVT